MNDSQIFVLAAGSSQNSKQPCSLWSFNNGGSILDWQTHAFEEAVPQGQINIVVGYDHQRIISSYPNLKFSHVLNWQDSSPLQSFLSVRHSLTGTTIAMYGDTIFHPETIAEFSEVEGDVVVAIDSVWKKRFYGRSATDISKAETLNIGPNEEVEYTGLIKFSPSAMEWILRHQKNGSAARNFLELIENLENAGFDPVTFDVTGSWAEMNEPNDLVHFILGNKAETLRRIQPQLAKSKICDQHTPTWQEWSANSEKVISDIQAQFGGQKLIVRSSSAEEDSWETANAGVFESILDIDCDNSKELRNAISDVFASYGSRSGDAQILVQPFVSDVLVSGVVFTCDLATGAPYYVLNYDDSSGKTDSITSGQKADLRTIVMYRQATDIIGQIDPRLEAVIEAVTELETILGYSKLDIEFALDRHGQVYTFQVRPIVVQHKEGQIDEKRFASLLGVAQKEFGNWQKKPPHLEGNYTIFSEMTDWNPAEIIGNRPNTLASSLYNHVITEDIWAKQRAEYGYRDVRPSPLVHHFCSQPYVDCRASINSFIPADLPDEVAGRLANAYLDALKDNPFLHDKIELEVVSTIWTPSFQEEAKKRFEGSNVTLQDIEALEHSLKKLTAQALERLDDDIAPVNYLNIRLSELAKADLSPICKAYQLIEDCRAYGTLAFSHAARAGFVAVTLLKSLVSEGAMSHTRMLEFQSSVPTVAGELQTSLADHSTTMDSLVDMYGHLRPGTYDIGNLAYWEKPDFYLNRKSIVAEEPREFVFNDEELVGLNNVLKALPTDISVNDLISYLKSAIQAREKTKFEFSKNLSAALDQILVYAEDELELSRELAGYMTYEDIRELRTGLLDRDMLIEFINLRKTNTEEKHLARLPALILGERDFLGFEQEASKANFITQLSVVADLAFIGSDQSISIEEKIVVIPNADPGYDWLFSHNIAGLITKYGGANSHMAIRCAELGIPAAIGVGDKTYETLEEGSILLDCLKGHLEKI